MRKRGREGLGGSEGEGIGGRERGEIGGRGKEGIERGRGNWRKRERGGV